MFEVFCSEEWAIKAKEFIENDYYHCPYLYTNLLKYGVSNPHTRLLLSCNDGVIQAVAFEYFGCLHLYFRKEMQDFSDIIQLVDDTAPRKIFMPNYMEDSVSVLKNYNLTKVLVMAPQHYIDVDTSQVKNATIEDLPHIAEFMYKEWSSGYVSVENIYIQLRERMQDHYGRTKYIEADGDIVACVSSYAELNDFAVYGGLLVSGSQRGKQLGSIMLKSICEELDGEGKKPCGLVVDEHSRAFHEKNGFIIVGKLAQLNIAC